MVTYNPQHTRILNSTQLTHTNQPVTTLNTNTSTFIKSSVSPCGQFLLTGSSDANAYIFPTSVNATTTSAFRRAMPPIVLRGHESEVTTVDWNPFNLGQCVTCSDDNTIRLWTVEHGMDDVTMGEFNFFKADVVEENQTEPKESHEMSSLSLNDSSLSTTSRSELVAAKTSNIDFNFISAYRVNGRIYGPNTASDRLAITNHYDDFIFRAYECQGPLARYSRPNCIVDLAELELAEKYESISLETMCEKPTPVSLDSTTPFIRFGPNDSLLSRLPINIIDEPAETTKSTPVKSSKPTETVTGSIFSLLSRVVKPILVKPRRKPGVKHDLNEQVAPGTPTTAKKRAPNDEDKLDTGQRVKRRVIVDENIKQPQTPKTTAAAASRTILHYFTPK